MEKIPVYDSFDKKTQVAAIDEADIELDYTGSVKQIGSVNNNDMKADIYTDGNKLFGVTTQKETASLTKRAPYHRLSEEQKKNIFVLEVILWWTILAVIILFTGELFSPMTCFIATSSFIIISLLYAIYVVKNSE